MIRGPGGRLSLTKVSILMSGVMATFVLIAQFYVEQHPSDELVLGLVGIFVLRHAWGGSKWSNHEQKGE